MGNLIIASTSLFLTLCLCAASAVFMTGAFTPARSAGSSGACMTVVPAAGTMVPVPC